jgi:hypothetical protein
MPGTKTSVWLGETEHARWKASGVSLTEIVKRGLDAPDPQEAGAAEIRAAIREELAEAEERIRRLVREELERVASR